MTVCTDGDFIVLPHWNPRPPAPWPDFPLSLHYPATEPTSPCPVLIMPNARLGSDTCQFKSHWFDSTRFRTHKFEFPNLPKWETDALLIRTPRLVSCTFIVQHARWKSSYRWFPPPTCPLTAVGRTTIVCSKYATKLALRKRYILCLELWMTSF